MRRFLAAVRTLMRMTFETGLGGFHRIFWVLLLSFITVFLWTPLAIVHWRFGPWSSLAVLCWEMTMLAFVFYIVEPWMSASNRTDEEKSRAWRSMFVMILMCIITTYMAFPELQELFVLPK